MSDEGDLFERYLADIEQYPVLTGDEELRLLGAIEAGAQARAALKEQGESSATQRRELEGRVTEAASAERALIQSNLRLVVATAREYHETGLPMIDLVQEGNLGLVRAVERFDPSEGTEFSAFASECVREAIERAANRDAGS